MTDDPASLRNLHDIVNPPPVPLFPPAPGWYWLGAILLLALVWWLWQLLRRHRADAYRRAALASLVRLQAEDDLAALPDLLKRTALAAFPRARVAGLSGAAWWRFLDATAGTHGFSDGVGPLLDRLAYDPGGGLDTGERERLLDAASHWLRQHRRDSGESPC
jgi:hypothetical protein